MRLHARIVRFLAVSALELLVPDIIEIPFKICHNFYPHFIATDPREKLELLQEAKSLTDKQIEEVTDSLAIEWQSLLPSGLSAAQRALLRQLVLSLHQA